MKVKEEILEQLEDMLYNYMQGEVDDSERELKKIFKFCVDNQPKKPKSSPAPQRKSCNFKPGDLVSAGMRPLEFVFLRQLENEAELFCLESKRVVWCYITDVTTLKPKQVVLSAPELMAVLESDGYQFERCVHGLGWINIKEALPNFFNVEMLHYCGKEPDIVNWRWNPRWLK